MVFSGAAGCKKLSLQAARISGHNMVVRIVDWLCLNAEWDELGQEPTGFPIVCPYPITQ